MKTMPRLLLALLAGASTLSAAEPPAGTGDYEFTLTPYAWAPRFKGESGIMDVSAPFDASFTDYADKLRGVLLLTAEARRDRWGLIVDGVWMRLEDDAGTPGPYLSTVEARLDMVMLEAAIAYRFVQTPRFSADILAGARYVHARVNIDAEPDLAAVGTVSGRVIETAGEELRSVVGAAVDDKKDDIARKVSWLGGPVGEQVRDAIDDVRLRPDADVVTGEIAARGGGFSGATLDAEVGRFTEAVGDAVAEHAARQIELLPPAQRHNPEIIKEAVARSAAKSLGALKREVSAQARSAIETAEAALNQRVAAGMAQAAADDTTASRDWIDPFVGLRARYAFAEAWSLIGYGDIGGFGVGSELTWQLFGGLAWQCSPGLALEFGYRHLDIDYDHDNFLLDTYMSGGALGVRITL